MPSKTTGVEEANSQRRSRCRLITTGLRSSGCANDERRSAFKVVRSNGTDEVLARAVKLFAFDRLVVLDTEHA
jgi:hypothetical protein